MSLKKSILKDGEILRTYGQVEDQWFVSYDDEFGNHFTKSVTPNDFERPIAGMPGYMDYIKSIMPELPETRRERYQNLYNLSIYDSQVLTAGPEIANYFDKLIEYCGDGKSACNWVMGSWSAAMKRDGVDVINCPMPPENLGELINLINCNIITHNLAKQIFEKMWLENSNAREIIEKYDMVQKQDSTELEKMVEAIIRSDEKAVEEYRNGKTAIIGHFVGKVMKETKGKSNPKIVNELVKSKLEETK